MLPQKMLTFCPSLSEKTLKNWCIEVPIELLVHVLTTDDPRSPETGGLCRFFNGLLPLVPLMF